MDKTEARRLAVVLGLADGITTTIGLIIGLRYHHSAIFAACIAAGLAELVGMAAGVWLASTRSVGNLVSALACGVATALGCIVPALPFLLLPFAPACVIAVTLVLAFGLVIACLRPERSSLALLETFGILLIAAVLCFLASLIKLGTKCYYSSGPIFANCWSPLSHR